MPKEKRFREPRLWSNRQLRALATFVTGDVINVSAGDDIDKEGSNYREYFSQATSYTISNFSGSTYRGFQERPNEIELDLTSPLPKQLEQAFDVVFSHTTLEHIFEIERAFHNLCSLSRDVVILVVPFCQVQHETVGYLDYWRFTPTCLRRFFEKEGFSVVMESANNVFNTSVYIFMVASRVSNKWHGILPARVITEPCGGWVGESLTLNRVMQMIIAYLRQKLNHF